MSFSYSVEDGNGGTASGSATLDITPAITVNHPPILVTPLVNQAVKFDTINWSYDVSTSSFSDEDISDSLSYSATLANGDPLPMWMQIGSSNGLITGSPGFSDRGTYALTITATDTHNASISAPLIVAVTQFNAGQLLVNTAADDVLSGTLSNDTATYAFASAPVTVSLATAVQQDTGGAGLDTLTNIDNLIGSNFSDSLTGNSQSNALDGGSGNDTLNGGVGADTMFGGLGNDNFVVSIAGDIVTEYLNEGTDKVYSTVTYTLSNNVEDLTLIGAAAINGTGNELANNMVGNAAINILNGGGGNDRLNGTSGADTLIGGLGDDIYVINNTGVTITENLGEGIDRVNSSVTHTLANNVDILVLTGASAIDGTGNGQANGILGNSAANVLNGGGGNDTLDGGAGINSLTGGTGNDIFRFTTIGHTDVITDYNVVNDTIQLENAVFTALTTTGVLTASQFRVGTSALDTDDFVIYNNSTGALLYDADGSGGGAAMQIATMGTNLALTNADIVVI